MIAAASAACVVHKPEAPALSGPSQLATALNMTAIPDRITQDGNSQSSVTVTAIGANGRPLSGLPIRLDMLVDGVLVDFGTLSAKSIVTGSDGVARAVYTAPSAPPPAAQATVTTVTVRAIPIGSDAQTSNPFSVDIRLMPQGIILPPAGTPTASFTITPTPVTISLPVTFDASNSQPGTNATAIASYSWNFGDGTATQSGVRTTHAFTTTGNFLVTLTVTNDRGLSASASQSVNISSSDVITGDWFTSPASVIVGQPVTFNASSIQTSPGHIITSYSWNFGDNGAGASGVIVQHVFETADTFQVQLTVTDDLGRSKVFPPKAISVTSGNPRPVITASPGSAARGATILFSSAGTQTFGGATIVSYSWTFGDGGISSEQNPVHTYSLGGSAGVYPVTLTVTDSQGRTGTVTIPYTVT